MFSEQEKRIYHCPHTGRDYDPLACRRGLTLATKGSFGRLCGEAKSPDPLVSAAAQETLLAAARRVFSWEPLKVLDATAWEALIAFTVWLRGKEQRASTPPEALPSSAGPGDRATKPGSP